MKKGLTIGLILGAGLLSGCSMYKKPVVPPAGQPDQFEVSLDGDYRALNNHWWENFNNPQLNDLVQKAIENNYSYQIAIQNIDIANTFVLQNMTALFPQMGADYSFSRNKQIVNVGNSVSSAPELTGGNSVFDLQLLAATVTYEVDVWNQVHNSVEQAKADKQTAEANTNVMRLSLISSVVNTYFQIMALNETIANQKAQYKDAKELVDLLEVQYLSGLVDDSKVYLAKNQAETIYSNLKVTEKQKQVFTFTLAYLLGEYPESFTLEVNGKLSDIKFAELVPEAIPSTMLGTRPDIQASFNTILSFGYIEKQNIANFLPVISLSGTFGYSNSTFAHLINSSNVLWTYGMNALQALIDYPALYSQWKRSQLQYDQAILAYKNTLINAYTEVEGAMVSYKEDDKVVNSYSRQLNNAKELLSISHARYQSGLVAYGDYLDNDLILLQTDYNLILKQLTLTQDIVQLYKAIGLGVLL